MAKRYSQPQSGPVRFDPKWLEKGLSQVFAGNRLIYDKNSRPQTATLAGGPKLVATPAGIVTGFGTTYGTGTSDRIDGPVLPAPASGLRSIVAHFNAKTAGGGGLGRIFQATAGTGVEFGEGLYFVSGCMAYDRATSSAVGQWGTTATIALGVRTSVGLSHNQTALSNTPSFFIEGKPAASSTLSTPAGTYGAGVAISWGNRASDSARGWDGTLGVILLFDGLLSATDHADLHANPWQVFTDTQRRIWVAAAGGGDHLITGPSSSQPNTSSTADITQTHLVSVASSTQANTATTASISQTHLITAAAAAIDNIASASSIVQVHLVGAASASQGNTTTTGSVGAVGSVLVSAASAVQANSATSSGIAQTYLPYTAGGGATAPARSSNALLSTAINLSARIRFVNDDGMLTTEAYRSLTEIVNRTGGVLGTNGSDTFVSNNDFSVVEGQQSAGGDISADVFVGVESQAMSEMVMQPIMDRAMTAPEPVAVGVSPFTYQSSRDGYFIVTGGTVSKQEYGRGATFTDVGLLTSMLPIMLGDAIRVTYTAAPTITFIPR